MSDTFFDFTLPFEVFAPFASVAQVMPTTQRWLDVFTGSAHHFAEATAGPAVLAGWLAMPWQNPFTPLFPFAPTPGSAAPREQVEWLHAQARQNLAQWRGLVDHWLDSSFGAAIAMADGWASAIDKGSAASATAAPGNAVDKSVTGNTPTTSRRRSS